MFSSTLSLFKKRERKKSGSSIGTPDTLDRSRENLDGIGHDYSYSQSYSLSYSQQATVSNENFIPIFRQEKKKMKVFVLP